MSSTYTLSQGTVPVLISMPHNGQEIPESIAKNMTDSALKVFDTDWYKDKLYDFAKQLGVYVINPKYSRYVIDLNRAPDGGNLYPGANSTELCPTTAFDLSKLYQQGKEPTKDEIEHRIKTYWQPYHSAVAETLNEIKQKFGKAVLLEAHSIKSEVPRFFDGQLPDFNFGTADGLSCSDGLIECVEALDLSPYTRITNGRFKGGYITRAYGKPEQNIHALQLELSQRTYLDESTLTYQQETAEQVKIKLKALVQALIAFAETKE